MDQLGPRLLIGTRHQLAKGAVERDKQPVTFIEFQTANQETVGPLLDMFFSHTDQPVEAGRRGTSDPISDLGLQLERVELFVVVMRQSLSSLQQFGSECGRNLNDPRVRKRSEHLSVLQSLVELNVVLFAMRLADSLGDGF